MALIALSVIMIKPTYATAPEKPKDPEPMTVAQAIEKASIDNGVSVQTMSNLAFCESSHRYNVYGDGTKAYGIYQFHKPTFDGFSKKYGLDLDYKSSYDQAVLASKMVKDGYSSHWTCWKKIKRV